MDRNEIYTEDSAELKVGDQVYLGWCTITDYEKQVWGELPNGYSISLNGVELGGLPIARKSNTGMIPIGEAQDTTENHVLGWLFDDENNNWILCGIGVIRNGVMYDALSCKPISDVTHIQEWPV